MAKYYAVKQGNRPGVYDTWEECQKQTKGYSGAIYKSFTNKEEAINYVAGDTNRSFVSIDYTIYSDGGCRGNNKAINIGAYAYIILDKDLKEIDSNVCSYYNTTNNKMELSGVIEALKNIKEPSNISVYSDSRYVVDGMNDWISGWKKNNWRTKTNEPVKNIDYWTELSKLVDSHKSVKFIWVKGHSNNKYNNKCDELLNVAMNELLINDLDDTICASTDKDNKYINKVDELNNIVAEAVVKVTKEDTIKELENIKSEIDSLLRRLKG